MNIKIEQPHYIQYFGKITLQLTDWDLQPVAGEGALIHYTGKYGHIGIKIYEGNESGSKLIWNTDRTIFPFDILLVQEIVKFTECFCNYLSIVKGKSTMLTFEITDGSFHPIESRDKFYGLATLYAIINCFDKEYNPISDSQKSLIARLKSEGIVYRPVAFGHYTEKEVFDSIRKVGLRQRIKGKMAFRPKYSSMPFVPEDFKQAYCSGDFLHLTERDATYFLENNIVNHNGTLTNIGLAHVALAYENFDYFKIYGVNSESELIDMLEQGRYP